MTVTLGGVAGLLAAIALLILVGFLAVPLYKLGKLFDSMRETVDEIGDESVPILTELQGTVQATNVELTKVGVVTDDAAKLSGSVSTIAENGAQLSNLMTTAVGGPIIRLTAFVHGLRLAVGQRRRRGERRRARGPRPDRADIVTRTDLEPR
ncbi:DUF948 domain-containing protein [Naumannella cuiyingiana]|uniref:Uncharacterized protein YoxC n=1 Tax=Naumannella cuiyingiana TaxID=1347891 RepID=A0A7Z0D627_9ACTN|nr:DUF948 domain-containing protein [Naumannella cuiyingiana]NYI69570.1 uncharacterized protein YoxC [Naumannella cuiyingiana]